MDAAVQFALIYKPICQYKLWHTRRLMSLAHCSALFLSPPLKDPGYRWLLSAIRCCVADVTAFIVTVIYWLRVTTATGRNTSKRGQALVKGSDWMPSPPNNFHPLPLRTAHFASGYCLAICCLLSFSTTPLSKHAVCAKWYYLPFASIIQLNCIESAQKNILTNNMFFVFFNVHIWSAVFDNWLLVLYYIFGFPIFKHEITRKKFKNLCFNPSRNSLHFCKPLWQQNQWKTQLEKK